MVERFDVAIKYPCGRDPYAVMVSVTDGSYVMAAHYDAARAEIERLEHLLDLSKKTTEAVLERAEKAETERDSFQAMFRSCLKGNDALREKAQKANTERDEARAQVAAAYEAAANLPAVCYDNIVDRNAIRAMTPADTITDLSERNRRLTAVVEEIASRQTLSGHDGDLDWLIYDARAALISGGRG